MMSSHPILHKKMSEAECQLGELSSLVQTSSRSLVLDVGEDRLVLTARPSLFHLDIFHPFLINEENSVAQYNNSTQVQNTQVHVVYTTHNYYLLQHRLNNTKKWMGMIVCKQHSNTLYRRNAPTTAAALIYQTNTVHTHMHYES